MSVLRKDPLSYGWVIFAEETYQRPTAPCPVGEDLAPADCPFCEGNEDRTPPEIRAIRPIDSKPNSRGWQVRTIPNQFAVLRIEGNLERRGEGLYDMMNGVGAHEVIVETPDHYGRMSQFDTAKLRRRPVGCTESEFRTCSRTSGSDTFRCSGTTACGRGHGSTILIRRSSLCQSCPSLGARRDSACL